MNLSCQRLTALLGLAALSVAAPTFASRWVEVGTSGVTTDKVMVDADSVTSIDQFKVVNVMRLYAAPRVNAHNITLDRHVQRTAFNCADRTFSGIRTVGFLGDKQVGSGPENSDWRTKMTAVGSDPLANRVLAIACAPSSAAGPPGGKPSGFSSGSGIVVDEAGDILTNNHVVDHCRSITVKTRDSRPLVARIVAADAKNDLALVKLAYDVPLGEPAQFRSQAQPARLGESVGVIGFPLTGMLSTEPKATFGQINSVAGMRDDSTLLQFSAPVQPGNSGGPVLDGEGEVIGVVVSQASLAVVAVAGNVPQNVNFAIRGEVAHIFLAARGIKAAVGHRQHPLSTEAIAAMGIKSTVLIQCALQ